MYHRKYHIHFVGIGGIGMSGIAELLHRSGYMVSGSDLKASETTQRLKEIGITFYEGHAADHLKAPDVVVKSAAIGSDNPELSAALQKAIPVIGRAEMLAEIMRKKFSILIAGSHGKTSTTGLVTHLLTENKMDPTVVIGGKLLTTGTNAISGRGDFFIAEADESDGSFLAFSPSIAIVTNIDLEHLDFYEDLEHIKKTFFNFLNKISFYGLAVLCGDDENIRDIIPHLGKRYMTYGIEKQADVMAKEIKISGWVSTFTLVHNEKDCGEIRLRLPGRHSIYNALASIAVALEIGFSYDEIRSGLSNVKGVKRRLEVKGEIDGVTILDDYAHHPTEIKTTLKAVSNSWPKQRVVAVFQPHRYSRTQALFNEFASCFKCADIVILTPIYAASEKAIDGIDSQTLCKKIQSSSLSSVYYAENFDACKKRVCDLLEPKDILITLGAGDIVQLGEQIITELTKKSEGKSE